MRLWGEEIKATIRPLVTHVTDGAIDAPRRPKAPTRYASAKLRVIDGSTGIPGPVVVETVIFFR